MNKKQEHSLINEVNEWAAKNRSQLLNYYEQENPKVKELRDKRRKNFIAVLLLIFIAAANFVIMFKAGFLLFYVKSGYMLINWALLYFTLLGNFLFFLCLAINETLQLDRIEKQLRRFK